MRPINLTLAGLTILALAASCGVHASEDPGTSTDTVTSTDTAGAGAQVQPKAPPSETAPKPEASPGTVTGKILETMDSGGYTYILLDQGGKSVWYAGPESSVAVGETVAVASNAMAPMRNFKSTTLDRTFEEIYFVSAIQKMDDSAIKDAVRQAHAGMPTPPPSQDVDLTGIEKPEGGMTVAEIFAGGAGGAGKDVLLRGKVVKFNANIMGINWLHVRDGSGGDGTNDITITSKDTAKVGDTVLVRGRLEADRDLGYGYKFALLIEDAKLTVE